MEQLRIRLLGGLEVYAGDTMLPSFPTQKSESLFSFLVLNRNRRFHRHVLCGHFWGDQPDSDARKALRTALWRIRSVLEPREAQRGTFLRVDKQFVTFPDDDRAWVDVGQFSRCLESPIRKEPGEITDGEAGQLAHAVSLYRGHLLEGNYDDWCLVDRERLRLSLLTALEQLVAFHRARRRWLEAINWGRRILREDPLREHIHRAIMICHIAMGDRPSAIRQYEQLKALLQRELEIEPMDETKQLYQALRTDGVAPPGPSVDRASSVIEKQDALAFGVDEALAAVYDLAGRLERARTTLNP